MATRILTARRPVAKGDAPLHRVLSSWCNAWADMHPGTDTPVLAGHLDCLLGVSPLPIVEHSGVGLDLRGAAGSWKEGGPGREGRPGKGLAVHLRIWGPGMGPCPWAGPLVHLKAWGPRMGQARGSTPRPAAATQCTQPHAPSGSSRRNLPRPPALTFGGPTGHQQAGGPARKPLGGHDSGREPARTAPAHRSYVRARAGLPRRACVRARPANHDWSGLCACALGTRASKRACACTGRAVRAQLRSRAARALLLSSCNGSCDPAKMLRAIAARGPRAPRPVAPQYED